MKTSKPIQIQKNANSASHLNYLKRLFDATFFSERKIDKAQFAKNEPTVCEMIAYCEKYVANLKNEIANGDGEKWMIESIKMEEAIIEILKSNSDKLIT